MRPELHGPSFSSLVLSVPHFPVLYFQSWILYFVGPPFSAQFRSQISSTLLSLSQLVPKRHPRIISAGTRWWGYKCAKSSCLEWAVTPTSSISVVLYFTWNPELAHTMNPPVLWHPISGLTWVLSHISIMLYICTGQFRCPSTYIVWLLLVGLPAYLGLCGLSPSVQDVPNCCC